MSKNPIKPRSYLVTDGLERAPARGMLRAVGMKDEDFEKPQIGMLIWNEVTPAIFRSIDWRKLLKKV